MAGKTKVAKFLKSRGSNQTEAAFILGITPQSLSRKANGHDQFKLDELKTLAKRYKMTTEEIMQVFF